MLPLAHSRLLVYAVIASFHGGSPFKGFVTPILFRIRGTAASTFNYSRDIVWDR